ncbi:MAG: metal ABC transporter ATP-binding protein [Gammaproteobacteria bacterium]|nr:metal ABC transporter ATP-binding protein [Gammaproteobacteria bacterium]MDD9885941.1 metal ABC transporter ATP-binding protein [Gammaproteobacteria bacterium]
MMKTLLLATAIGCALAGGCATNPDNIEPTALSPLSYKEYSCEEIAAEISRVAERESELRAVLKERADTDAVQMGVATLLFFPTLFWIDGDGPDTLEYARLKGEHKALTEAAASRQCTP